MKVADLQAYLLSSPLPEPLAVQTAGGEIRWRKKDCLLVRIQTDQGQTGFAAGPASANLAQLINRNLKPAVVNLDPTKLDSLRKKVFQRRPQFPGLSQAFGLVEVALLDLRGKIEGRSLSELLGGQVRKQIPLIASAGLYLSPEQCAEEAAAIAADGFSSYKFRAGLGPAVDAQTVHAVRRALPPACRMIVDARCWWQMGTTYRSRRLLDWTAEIADCHPLWLAEAFPLESGLAERIGNCKSIVFASGELESSAADLRAHAERASFEVAQLNVTLLGGLQVCRELLRWFSEAGKRCILTGGATPLEVLTLAHLASCASLDVCLGVDWPCHSTQRRPGMFPFPLGDELLKQPPMRDNGSVILTNAPGVGGEVNEGVIQRYPWKSDPGRGRQ